MVKFINVGHRGAAAYAPENTLASFAEAIACKADMIEFDIRRTLDRVLIVHHDRAIVTPSGRQRAISHMTYAELLSAAEARGFALATFEEVLRSFGPRIPMNIEVKVGGFERDIIDLLHQYPPSFEPTISSFLPWVVARIKRFDKRLKTGLVLGQERLMKVNILAPSVVKRLIWALGIGAMHLQKSIITQDVVSRLSGFGLTVFVWTVDDPSEMRRFIKMGVDGIITNRPDTLYETCLDLSRSDKPTLKEITDTFGRFAFAV